MAQPEPHQDVAGLAQQIELLRADLALISETLTAFGQSSGDTVHDLVAARAESLLAKGEAKLDEAGDAADAALADLSDFAQRNPLKAMVLAGGFGLLLGLLFGRR